MKNNGENSNEIELNELFIEVNNNNGSNKTLEDKKIIKSIYLDDSFINKIFFIWNIKSTYLEKKKNVDEYHFIYYSLTGNKQNGNLENKIFYYSFFSFYKMVLGSNLILVFITIFLAMISGILDFAQYSLFRNLLSVIKSDTIMSNSYYYNFVIKFILFKIFHVITSNNLYFYENYLPVRISNQIIILIYKKVIKLTEDHSKDKLLGKIINLIQTDVENIAFIFNYGPSSLVVPIQILMVLYNAYNFYNDLYLLLLLIVILIICFVIAFIIQK